MSRMVCYGLPLNLIGLAQMTVTAFVMVVPQRGIGVNLPPQCATMAGP